MKKRMIYYDYDGLPAWGIDGSWDITVMMSGGKVRRVHEFSKFMHEAQRVSVARYNELVRAAKTEGTKS